MSQKRFLKIKDFEKTQRYKDRNPLWIKLDCALIDDYIFARLPDETKYHAVALSILASRLDNKFPEDELWLRQKINSNTKIDLEILLEIGFLEVIKGARKRSKIAFNDCKSNKINNDFGAQKRREEKREEEKRRKHNTAEETREQLDAENAAAVCVVSENLSENFGAIQTGNNLRQGNFGENAQGSSAKNSANNLMENSQTNSANNSANHSNGIEKRSEFTLEECLKYVEKCLATGEDIKNTRGLAQHLFKTGEADAFIRHALYPEKQTEIDFQIYGEPIKFSVDLCRVCFGAKMADADGRGYRKCEHCKNERGKPTGFKPQGAIENVEK